jgi:hypothetical protein
VLKDEKKRAEGKSHPPATLVFLGSFRIPMLVLQLQMGSMTLSAEMQALQVAYNNAQGDLEALEAVALEVCKEIKRAEGQSSGSSIASCLRSLGSRVVERPQGALHLGVQMTLRLTSMYYLIDFNVLREGYPLPEGVEGDDVELQAIREADATVVGPTAGLAELFMGDLFPDAVEDEAATTPSPHIP